ncbi:hypothetical protein RI119_04800 [Bacillus amyloliquefaciens]
MDDAESALDKCVRACQKLNRARHAADIAFQSGVCLLQNAKLSFSDTFSLFLLFPDFRYIEIVKAVCICILILVVIGWRPRLTGFFHWWISYSFQNSAVTLDGGDQVAAVFTLLLLPLTLTDPRKWHWSPYEASFEKRPLEPSLYRHAEPAYGR